MNEYLNHLDMLPPHMADAMKLYIENGIPPGSFLSAVLSNDLMGALGRADDVNRSALHRYGTFLYSYAPPACFGSPDLFLAWVERGGLAGQEAA